MNFKKKEKYFLYRWNKFQYLHMIIYFLLIFYLFIEFISMYNLRIRLNINIFFFSLFKYKYF